MSDCELTERQKNLLRSIVPGLKDNSVSTDWFVNHGDNGFNGILGLPKDIFNAVWRDLRQSDLMILSNVNYLE